MEKGTKTVTVMTTTTSKYTSGSFIYGYLHNKAKRFIYMKEQVMVEKEVFSMTSTFASKKAPKPILSLA